MGTLDNAVNYLEAAILNLTEKITDIENKENTSTVLDDSVNSSTNK